MENSVTSYGVGDEIVLEAPEMTNNLVFGGWYTDSEMTNQYTPGQVESTMTIYCKWQAPIALYGEYKGLNTWGTGDRTFVSPKEISVDPYGATSGHRTGTIQDYDPETGTFKLVSGSSKYYGYYDAENGVLAYADKSGTETLADDLYVFVKGVSSCEVTDRSHWNGGNTKLLALKFGDNDSKKTANVFVFEDKVYYGVSFTSTDGSVTATTARDANQLSVFDEDGNLIASFVKGDSGLEKVTAE